MPTPHEPRWIKLVRISKDRDNETSTATQNYELDTWVSHNGGTVVQTFVEEGRSGFKKIPRPYLDEALRLVRTGMADGILIWKLDRFTRKGAIELFRMVSLVSEGNGCIIATHDDIDTRRKGMADVIKMTVIAELAKAESEAKSDRTSSWHRGRMRNVTAPNGPRPYGYDRPSPDCLIKNEDEALIIKRMASDVLNGQSLRSIARALNEEGIASKTGAPWSSRGVKFIVTNATTAGGRIIDGEFHQGKWAPILTRDEWEQVNEVLRDPDRLCVRPDQRRRRWLLTGLAQCDRCDGGRLLAKPHKDGQRYSCTTCGLSIAVTVADAVVESTVLEMLSGEAWNELRASGQRHNNSAVAFLRSKIDAAKDRWMAGSLSDDDYFEHRDELKARIEEIESATPVAVPDVPDIRKAWATWGNSVDLKRQVISACTESIRIKAFGPGATKYDRVIID